MADCKEEAIENPCDPKEQQSRADFLELLYEWSKRDTGVYTGLWQAFATENAVKTRNSLLALRESKPET